jgi:pimeloyl-ACP methyl ester carboxylesterase
MHMTERIVRANGVDLCVEIFGSPHDPAILLVGNSMLTWPDELCGQLAAAGRQVVRYDLRDTGRSTAVDPEAPAYTLRDLVADAVGLLDMLAIRCAHVVGFATGGWIAQLLALDHPARLATLTLIATRPTAPGPSDPDLPEHAPELMAHLMSAPQPDWSDRTAVIEAAVVSARLLAGSGGFVESDVRATAGRIFDRVGLPAGADLPAAHRSNLRAVAFAGMDSGDRWRERLGGILAPTLVIHGDEDLFFPLGNGAALANEIPAARLVTLSGIGQALPRSVWPVLSREIVRHTGQRA